VTEIFLDVVLALGSQLESVSLEFMIKPK
jgi:hypothetical protein